MTINCSLVFFRLGLEARTELCYVRWTLFSLIEKSFISDYSAMQPISLLLFSPNVHLALLSSNSIQSVSSYAFFFPLNG